MIVDELPQETIKKSTVSFRKRLYVCINVKKSCRMFCKAHVTRDSSGLAALAISVGLQQ